MSMRDPSVPDFADIERASERLCDVAIRTPVHTSSSFNARIGAEVFFKCENFQRVGAFKFRGAYNALAALNEEAAGRGVITHSSGNHAQAIALAGKLLGIPRTIVMPNNAPAVKRAATREYGAQIVSYDPAVQQREALSMRLAAERGLTLIPPFDHSDVIAGQGTVALELLQDVPDLDVLLVCLGGGGLLSGCAIAARAMRPNIRVIGVEPELANSAELSLKQGHLVQLPQAPTIADGARTSICERTLKIIRAYVDAVVSVPDQALVDCMHFMYERMKLVIEPTGALAASALFSKALQFPAQRIGVVISGGNVDLAELGAWFKPKPSVHSD
jgi:threo-3-hydroxy-L-aspartate ammonia-lyase